MRYLVQSGDTLYRIAEEYNLRVEDLLRVNPQITDPSALVAGQVLNIPPVTPVPPPGRYGDYVVKRGEDIPSIARKLGISVNALLDVNPDLPVRNFLLPGQLLRVPAEVLPIVDYSRPYGYNTMQRDLNRLLAKYPFLVRSVAGHSVLGREIPLIRLGHGPKEVYFNGGMHAREWITVVLLMKFIEEYARAYQNNTQLGSIDIRKLFNDSTIWIMPMVNPDGIDLVINGLRPDNPYYNQLIEWNNGSTDFSAWKANIRGVDINRNFDEHWPEVLKESSSTPTPESYAGTGPESEPETKAIADFVRSRNLQNSLNYHAQGEVIYWGYKDVAEEESKRLVDIFAKLSGYKPIKQDFVASYKDWFMYATGKPAFGPEIGRGSFPIPPSQFPEIFDENLGIMLTAAAN